MTKFNALYGRVSGAVEIQDHHMVFTSDVDGSKIELPFSRLEMSLEGQNSHHYFFYHSHDANRRICVQDSRVVKVLAERGVESASHALKKSRKRNLQRALLVASPILAIVAFLVVIPLLLTLAPASWVTAVVSPEQEKAIGGWIFPLVRYQFQVVPDHPAQPFVQALVDHMKESNLELRELDIVAHVSTSSEVNAFAAPGYNIVVNRGLIDKADSIEEVVGVLAHELGHLEQRHAMKSLAGSAGSLTGLFLLGTVVGMDAAAAVTHAAGILNLKYSRDEELAADRRGFLFLQRAHVPTEGMISFFEKMAREDGSLPKALSFFSTHPASSERVKVLAQMAQESPLAETKPLPVSLLDLRSAF